ncbi:CxxxxCH/CxxCH domain c-type cytochrome [Geoalkalibacter sp.]|uniref:CxxxxCH/CxxCH domain c-type cytochrome n=1 Tax=Geoalkalibacter sp. TaxID=3041440 RepID=UPI00272DF9C4|nr:CxxxxCH/CxxCH domain-containing protein [Geoalkalibacter sp.]
MQRWFRYWALALVLALVGVASAHATAVHNFDCKNCHKIGVSFTDLGQGTTNICLQCHKDGASLTLMLDNTLRAPVGLFAPGDASNAMGSYPNGMMPGAQTSHMWAGKDVHAAAGAKAPTNRVFYGRYGISTGKLTCQRCHDPHSTDATNTKILRLGTGSTEALCVECHATWAVGSSERGLLSHPMVSDYAAVAAASPDDYRPADQVEAWPGDIQLVNGGVGCSSCHGVHFADSSSDTPVASGQAGMGDGKLLRADGSNAADKSTLCQACHTYKPHGSIEEEVGCLVCHSGHNYNGGGAVNYFVLRNQAQTATYPAPLGTNLRYTTLPSVHGGTSTVAAQWAGTPGAADGYCERCHGELTSMPRSARTHLEGENCLDCHSHNGAGMPYSFAANCNDCHGFPPADTSQGGPGGYAYVADPLRDYSAQGFYKPENLTPHSSHSGASSGYSFSCGVCHNADDFAGTHNQGTFQDVLLAGNSFAPLTSGNGVLNPTYNPTGSGSCSNVYCHSNGGRRNASGSKVAGDFVAVTVSWGGGKGAITGCTACHGNDAASMSGKNSAAHQKHLAKYACNVCHAATAGGPTALISGAKGGTHVNGVADISFAEGYNLGGATLGAGTYNQANGTCAVYCHSDGKSNLATPDWDDLASGACGSCHAVDGTSLSGSHAVHVSPSGANIGCASCHGAGAGGGTHAGHVNGAVTLLAGVCTSCHAVNAGQPEPAWGNAASADCVTCHAGATTTSYTDNSSVVRQAAAKTAYHASGHGKTGVEQGCTVCHATGFDAAHMGAGATTRLKPVEGQSYTAEDPNAFCGACHSFAANAHFTTGDGHASTDAGRCNVCHDPHGVAGYDAMVRDEIDGNAVAAFADRTARSSYANSNFDGVCQVCHVSGEVNHFNRAANNTLHGGSQVCLDCHSHTAETAFEVTCYGCHGGGYTGTTSGRKNFWPDGVRAHGANDAGAHQTHVLKIAERLDPSWTSINALLNGVSDAQQKQLCEYCHAAVANDDDHITNSRAEVFSTVVGGVSRRFAKKLWDGSDDALASFNPANNTCANMACHNGKTTPVAYSWYAGAQSRCEMCHITDLPTADATHAAHLYNTIYYNAGRITCADCHTGTSADSWSANQAPAAGHIDGTFSIAGSRNLSYTGTYPSTKGGCGTNSCHNDGKGGAPYESVTWGTSNTQGCASCHTNSAEGHLSHFLANNVIVAAGFLSDCSKCHLAWQSPAHFNGSVSLRPEMNYSGNVEVGVADTSGTCTTTVCHQDGRGNAVQTPAWDRAPVSGDECYLCHSNRPATGSHATHVQTVATAYTTAKANNSSAAEYDFNCANCHGATLANHMNGNRTLVDQGWNGTSCTASYCHSDGKYNDLTYAASPAWNGGTFSGDRCAGCHKNSPDTNAHHEHEVGFHFDAVYSGTTGFLPVRDSDPVPGGLTYGNKDEIRGHGGRLADGVTSTSTVLTCHVCHNATVTVWHNDKNTKCASCHDTGAAPPQGEMVIADKSKHVDGNRDVRFFNQKVRSKAQLRDIVPDLPGPNPDWTEIPELQQSWVRVNGYKAADGSSYDESPDTLYNTGIFDNGAGEIGGTPANPTCLVSCHLTNKFLSDNNLDKDPVGWSSGTRSCIDCHTRLPK